MSIKLKDRLRENIKPEDFGVSAEFSERAKNYARWFAAKEVDLQTLVWKREAEKMRAAAKRWAAFAALALAAGLFSGVLVGHAVACGAIL